jgi:ornithine cyclodeaminase/alanine dehydrogenase-like protein (mu-crystallin family)
MAPPPGPRLIDAAATRAALPMDKLIDALHAAFVAGADTPLRHRHSLPGGSSLLLMPAWQGRAALGVKIVSVFPGNGALGLNAVSSTYLLCDGATGRHLAIIDGNEITGRRTAAASALAGRHLARADASHLLIVGSGHVAGLMAEAWSAVRAIHRVTVWNVRHAGAERLAAQLQVAGFNATATEDLEAAVRAADIVSCATLSNTPLVRGAWLQPGTHLDLVGAYMPTMREADDDAVRLSRVFIDTDAALAEGGDIIQPLQAGVIGRDAIAGTLFSLCRGEVRGRGDATERTLFKSVGSAIEDLAAAALVAADGSVAT